jgi:hypothetical protein
VRKLATVERPFRSIPTRKETDVKTLIAAAAVLAGGRWGQVAIAELGL